jgi:hypothetical protein
MDEYAGVYSVDVAATAPRLEEIATKNPQAALGVAMLFGLIQQGAATMEVTLEPTGAYRMVIEAMGSREVTSGTWSVADGVVAILDEDGDTQTWTPLALGTMLADEVMVFRRTR